MKILHLEDDVFKKKGLSWFYVQPEQITAYGLKILKTALSV